MLRRNRDPSRCARSGVGASGVPISSIPALCRDTFGLKAQSRRGRLFPTASDALLCQDSDQTLGDFLEDGVHALPDRDTDAILQRRFVAELLETLDPRSRSVLCQRFSLHGPERTLDAVSQELGVSRERVRQIEREALGKLKALALSCLGAPLDLEESV
ncbi:MAG: hypothetical protein D6791_18220 [Chloroflexi bacterium]|nr:MAG: hypothetical protein D6791_18220 [Chloroflexota bacterium]